MNGSIGFVMEWSNAQELLAVAGTLSQSVQPMDAQGALVFHNVVKFYTETGYHLYTGKINDFIIFINCIDVILKRRINN